MVNELPVDRERKTQPTIFDLLTAYHQSLDNMKAWLDEAGFDEIERIGIADAWMAEMSAWFESQGYCFACNKELARCECVEDEHA